MGEYRCEGISNVKGGTYDKLHTEGIFNASGPIEANYVSGEGVMNFTSLSTEALFLEGVTNIKSTLEAVTCNIEGVLNAAEIIVAENINSDGVINANRLKAKSATLLHNSKKEFSEPFAKIRAFFSGRDVQDEKNARIHEIEADTLVLEGYSVKKITGRDVIIGKNCIVGAVQADTKLRIHSTAQVKDLGLSVQPEYFE